MDLETLNLEREDGLGVLTLNRPEARNAVSFTMLRELRQVLDELDQDVKTRVVVLHGAGKGFCSGADIRGGSGKKEDTVWEEGLGKVQMAARMQNAYGRVTQRLREIHQPLIAAVHGSAVGAGFSLAMTCDVRLASPSAKFAPSFIRIGITGGDMGSAFFLPKIVGPALAAEILFTGRDVSAEEALAIGLVNRIVEEEKLLEEAKEMGRAMIATASPFGMRLTKEMLNLSLSGASLETMLHVENRSQVLALQTGDFFEAVAAFMQKRPPKYRDA